MTGIEELLARTGRELAARPVPPATRDVWERAGRRRRRRAAAITILAVGGFVAGSALRPGRAPIDPPAAIDPVTAGTVATTAPSPTVGVESNSTDANTAPVPLDDRAVLQAGTSILLAVLANDVDPDGDALLLESVVLSSGDARYEVIGSDVRIDADPEFVGTVILTYVVADEHGARAHGEIRAEVLDN